MANLRVFVSSTYYDLHHVRNDLYTFIKGMGHEPVMHDKGGIPYTQEKTLEESCYTELQTCDIVICIIGNKYGTESMLGNYSITMDELKTAIKARKKVYTYIVKDVYIENQTYEKNKDSGLFKPAFADDIRIHEFISELKATIKNSPIQSFEAVADIITNLKSQFSGLFQHLLAQEASATESKTVYDLQATSDEIKNLIKDISRQNDEFVRKFDSTMYATIPALTRIRQFLGMKESLFYAPNKRSVVEFLTAVGFSECEESNPFISDIIMRRDTVSHKETITLKEELFDSEGHIKSIKNNELDLALIFSREALDDGLPF